MQWHSSTNKSPTKLNAAEIKFDTGDFVYKLGKPPRQTPPGEFKVTTLKNPLLSITSGYKYKESYQTFWSILKYRPTVNLYPNTQLDLYCSGNLSLDARIPIRD